MVGRAVREKLGRKMWRKRLFSDFEPKVLCGKGFTKRLSCQDGGVFLPLWGSWNRLNNNKGAASTGKLPPGQTAPPLITFIIYQFGKYKKTEAWCSTTWKHRDKAVFITSWKVGMKEELRFVAWWLLPLSNNNVRLLKGSLWITPHNKRSCILRVNVCSMPIKSILKNLVVGLQGCRLGIYVWLTFSCP